MSASNTNQYSTKAVFSASKIFQTSFHYYRSLFTLFVSKEKPSVSVNGELREKVKSRYVRYFEKCISSENDSRSTRKGSDLSENYSDSDVSPVKNSSTITKSSTRSQVLASHASLHLYGLKLVSELWDKPHYRTGTFLQDLKANLSNVSVPGTCLPLSVFCLFGGVSKVLFYCFILFVFPFLCFMAGFANEASKICILYKRGKNAKNTSSNKKPSALETELADYLSVEAQTLVGQHPARLALSVYLRLITNTCVQYQQHLILPNSWFFYWRLNCALASYAAFADNVTSSDRSSGFSMENKWDFLVKCSELNIPATPCLGLGDMKDAGFDILVAKHRNEEGGMGIQFLHSASAGGDWILQPKLDNANCMKRLLPENAPFSTFRVLTSSEGAIFSSKNSTTTSKKVTPLTCVFRAGRKNAKTDHAAVFYNVEIDEKSQNFGKITRGSLNAHWYHVGAAKCLNSAKEGCWTKDGVFAKGFASQGELERHPDSGKLLIGEGFKSESGENLIKQVLDLCVEAHAKTCPDVPFCGWDVGIIDESSAQDSSNKSIVKPLLVETNLSCNFFLGDFNRSSYFDYCERLLVAVEGRADNKKTQ